MRLVCPNCDAKYEVPDDAIPEIGRDVQCANCNHAWFQMRPGTEAASRPYELSEVAADDGLAAPSAGAAAAAPVGADAGKGYGVDDSVLAILREEAQREALVRRGEEPPLETQPDLGLDAATVVQERTVNLYADDAARPSARRDLLPNVDEINSTLRPSSKPVDLDAAVDALPDLNPGRSSFRSGFIMMLALAVLGLAAYLAAPQLAEQVPALQAPLTAYVGFVDMLRLQLDGLMQSATLAISGEG